MGVTQSGFGGAALLLSTGLAFAGGPGECAAQTGADSAGGLAMGTAIYLVARLAGADSVPLLTLATGVVHAVLVIDGAA